MPSDKEMQMVSVNIRQSHRVALAVAFAAGVGLMMSMPARSQGMGGGMMGGGMMGGGMMHR